MKPCFALLAFACVATPFTTSPAHAATFTVSGRAILRDGAPFQVRGVDYQPAPIGENPAQSPPYGDYYTANYAALRDRDLPLMRAMGVNTIRIYGWDPIADHSAFLDACYNGGTQPIFVLVNRWIDPATNWSNATAVNAIRDDFLTLEAHLANHPAVLGLVLGNEANNANGNGANAAFWSAINTIAAAIKAQNSARLVSTAITDALTQVSARDATMTALDFWSIQVYRGTTFGSFFTQYATASSRPLIVTEFGVDAFNQTTAQPYPNNAEFPGATLAALWGEVAANTATCAGACVFEFADEWWKTASGSASAHDTGGFALGGLPDGFANEEWWGLHAVADNGASPDVLTPRAGVALLTALWGAPTITTPPVDAAATYLDDVTFALVAGGTPAPAIQWQVSIDGMAWNNVSDDATFSGATTTTLALKDVTVAMSGQRFRAIATNGNGSATSAAALLTVSKATAIVMLSQLSRSYTGTAQNPTAITSPAGLAVEFAFGGSATPPTDAGSYAFTATIDDANYTGIASDTFVIAPALVLDEFGPVVTTAGSVTTLGVSASGGSNAAYQWQLQAAGSPTFVDLAGANAATFVLPSTQRFQAGAYRVVVTINGASATSASVALAVVAAAPTNARLLNLSTRGLAGADAAQLFPGFVISGTGTKKLLIRAVGPSLARLGFTAPVIPDPHMQLKRLNFTTGAYEDLESNDDWGTNANAAAIATTSVDLSAFALTDPREAALLVDLPAGQYAVIGGDKDGTSGIGIVELYDADPANPTTRLVNISNRGFCGVGDEVMIPGFVISSEGAKTLLVRAVGPTLAGAPFNVPGTLADPKLTLYRTNPGTGVNTALFTQDNWSDNPDAAHTAQVAAHVSAFTLATGSADAAFVVTLEPGVYTVVGSSADGTSTGIVLVEVYVAS